MNRPIRFEVHFSWLDSLFVCSVLGYIVVAFCVGTYVLILRPIGHFILTLLKS
jgi:hypothetical protein